jgi:hypothetical protein
MSIGKVRMASPPLIMLYMISRYFMYGDKMALKCYKSVYDMCVADDDPLLALSIKTYGNENISMSRELALLKAEMAEPTLPVNYYPARSLPAQPFDYKSEFFCESGEVIKYKN